jgi:hypothetical protein
MHAKLNVRFKLSIDKDKTIPLAALTKFVTEQDIDSVLLERIVKSLDAARVEALCRQKRARDNGTSTTNEPIPILELLSQPPMNTSSLSTTSEILLQTTTNPNILFSARQRRSRLLLQGLTSF